MNKTPLFKAIVIILILFLSMVLIFFTAKEILIWKDIYSVYGAVGSFMLSLLCLAGVRRLIAPPVLPNDLKIVSEF